MINRLIISIFLLVFSSEGWASQYLEKVRSNYKEFDNYSLNYIIDKNPQLIMHPVYDDQTLLQATAMLGDLEAIRFLLELGASPNVGSPRPIESALSRLTVGYGFVGEPDGSKMLSEIEMLESIKILLDYKADLSFQPEIGAKIYKSFFEILMDKLCSNDFYKGEFLSVIYDMKIDVKKENLGKFYLHILSSLGDDVFHYNDECVKAFEYKIESK